MGNCFGGHCCVSAPHNAQAFSTPTEELSFKGSGASYKIKSGGSEVYTFKIGQTTKVYDAASSSIAFVIEGNVLKAADETTVLGSIESKRCMSGHLCYEFKAAETDLVMTSADCQQMCHCDVPIYKAKLDGVNRISDVKVDDLVAACIDGPSGVSITQLQGMDEDMKRAVVAINIIRLGIQMLVLKFAVVSGGAAALV